MEKKVYGIVGLAPTDNITDVLEKMDFSNYGEMIKSVEKTGIQITDRYLDMILVALSRTIGVYTFHIPKDSWKTIIRIYGNGMNDDMGMLQKHFTKIYKQLSWFHSNIKDEFVYMRVNQNV